MFLKDLFAIDGISLRDSLDNHGDEVVLVILAERRPDDVSLEQDILDLGGHGDLVKLIPRSNSVVAEEEGGELDAVLESVDLIDLVVGEPELFEGLTDFIKSHDSLNVVTRQGENFDVLKLGECGHSLDGVGG